MSLLLDALKKAEKAKEDAQRGDKPNAPRSDRLSLEPSPEEAKRVMTRDKLPDISTSLEIESDDLSPRQSAAAKADATAAAPMAPANPEATAPPAAPACTRQARPTAAAARAAADAPQRAAAEKVFQAKKFKEPNPRLPFYITMGVLGLFALGTIVYFWIQLRPLPPLVNANPAPPSGEQPVKLAAAPLPQVDPRAGARPPRRRFPVCPLVRWSVHHPRRSRPRVQRHRRRARHRPRRHGPRRPQGRPPASRDSAPWGTGGRG